MTHTSPATSALWSILSVILFCYLVTHLWKFDRFACVKWNRGNSGAFKRVMTRTILMVYSITMTVIKYDEGYAVFPGVGIVPKPYQLWTHPQRTWLTAIYIMFATAWALEIVSHLEELCFWLFLINVGAAQTSWFRSIHFKCWVVGSLAAVVGLPVLAVFTRDNPLKVGYLYLSRDDDDFDYVNSAKPGRSSPGRSALCSSPSGFSVLWLFPAFLRRVKNEGAEPEVVVRLSTFHELNIIRVVFRFMFVLPLMTLAADGIKPSHNHVNESPFWTDLLAMLGAIGCIVSSIITLLIFFPRSIAKEAGYKPRQKTLSQNSRGVHVGSRNNQNQAQQIQSNPTDVKDSGMYDAAPEPTYAVPKQVEDRQVRIGLAPIDRAAATGGGAWEMVDYQQYQQHGVILPTVAPRVGGVMRRQTALHPMVLNYTSPIDLIEGWDESDAFRPTHY
ncbi:transmembrane protein [Ceratobasidium sp. AG-Ba]|nr:transmembrane protein [Ceratobasidium sp. AG-Ba]